MALVLADRIRETTTTAGAGTITLAGAVTGYRSFATVGNGNTTYYTIAGQTTGEWEVGIGTYTAADTTLSRTTVLSSSNAGSLVVFSAGTKDVFVTYPAGKSINQDAVGGVTINAPTSGAALTVSGTVSATSQINAQAFESTSTPGSYAASGGANLSYSGSGVAVLNAYSNSAGTGTGQISFKIASTQSMLLDSSGNIGINGAAKSWGPLYKAVEFGAANSGIFVNTSNNNVNLFNNWYADSSGSTLYSTTGFAQQFQLTRATGDFVFLSAPSGTAGTSVTQTEKMRIYNAGGVLISAPTSGTALTVSGAISALGDSASVGYYLPGGQAVRWTGSGDSYIDASSGSTTGTLRIRVSSAYKDVLDVGPLGNVTINAPTSGFALSVSGSTQLNAAAADEVLQIRANSNPYVSFYQSGTLSGYIQASGSNFYLVQSSAGTMYFNTGGNNRLSIANAGNVTINAPTSGAGLTVTGASGYVAGLFVANGTSGSSYGLLVKGGTTSADYALRVNNNADSPMFQVGGAGNVSIAAPTSGESLTVSANTSGNLGLLVSGGVLPRVATLSAGSVCTSMRSFDSSLVGIIGTESNHAIWVRTNDADRMVITNTGNVTINAPTSGSTLYLNTVAGTQAALTINDGTRSGQIDLTTNNLEFGTTTAHGVNFFTNSGNRLTITNTGNTTINAPTSGTALAVNGVSGYYTEYIENPGQAGVRLNTAGTTGIYTSYAQSGTIGGYIGIGASVITGAASTDLCLTSNGGNIYFGRTGGSAIAMQILAAGNVTINAPTSGTTLRVNAAASGVTNGLYVVSGDITASRSSTTGVIYFGDSGTKYVYYDGTNYNMPNGQLYVNSTQVVLNSGSWGINVTGSSASCTGNAATATSATSATSASQLSGITLPNIFDNMGQPHATQNDFNSITDFGFRYVQGATNGPGITSATQYYGITLGLGSEYVYSNYASQLYWPRTPLGGNPYLSVRFREATTWGSWAKIYAGYADTAGAITSQGGLATLNANQAETRNISGKSGVTKTISASAATGGSDGDIWYQY